MTNIVACKLPRPKRDGAFSSPQNDILQRARHHFGASRRVYDAPQRGNIFCPIHIRISNPAAILVQTLKLFALPVANHLAAMARLRRVARIYKPDADA